MAQLTLRRKELFQCSDNTGMPLPGVSVLVKGTKLEHKLILTENISRLAQMRHLYSATLA
jgi:hypothetical protein